MLLCLMDILFQQKTQLAKNCFGRVPDTTDIKDINPCPADRNTFFSKYPNKEAFVKFLGAKLELLGFDIIQCPSDADTTIAKVDDKPVSIAFTQMTQIFFVCSSIIACNT